MEIWEPKPPGTFWATPGLLRDCFLYLRHASADPEGGMEVKLIPIRNLVARRCWLVSNTSRPPYPGQDLPVFTLREAGWASRPVWTGTEYLAPTNGTPIPDLPTRSEYCLIRMCPCRDGSSMSRRISVLLDVTLPHSSWLFTNINKTSVLKYYFLTMRRFS
jgi:hypothetical protein